MLFSSTGITVNQSKKRRCVDNIKMNIREMGWGGMHWIKCGSGYGPVEGSCEHGDEPSGSIKCWKIFA
jgi:hypothetical protein